MPAGVKHPSPTNNTPIRTTLTLYQKPDTNPAQMTADHPPTPYLNYKYYVKPNAPLIPLLQQPPLRRIRRPHKRPHFHPMDTPHFTTDKHTPFTTAQVAPLR